LSLIEIDDSLELPKLDIFIAKPNLNRNIIGKLSEAYNINYTPKLGNINEITFTIPYLITRNHKLIENPNITKIKDRYFLKVLNGTKEEWFRIDTLNESSDNNGEFLEVHAFSLGIELGDKTVRLIDETSKDVEYMMGLCLSDTLWSVGFVDTDISTDEHGIYIRRSFDVTETTKLDFLYQIAETFKGVIVWNTVNRTVSLRTQDNIGSNKGLRISYGKYMKSLEKESNSNEMVTRLIPHGRDNLSIRSVSPTGLDYIDDFSYFMYPFERDADKKVIHSSHYMSDELCHALLDYSELLEENDGKFSTLLTTRNEINNTLLTKENELITLNMALSRVLDSIDIEKANNRDYSSLESERQEIQSQIDAKQSEIDTVKSQLNANQLEMNNLQELLKTENNFSNEEIMELNTYIIEKHWSDNNIINPEDLLKETKKAFDELRQPATVFTIDIVNFTQILEGQKDWGKLNIGDTIYIHHERLNESITAKITEFEINYENQSVSLTIANTKDILSAEEKFYKRLADANMTSATIDVNKYRWKDSSEQVSELEKMIDGTWDATKREIVAGVNESVEISNRGIRITDSQDPNRMLIIQNGVLALSEDKGENWKTAITPSYISAEVLNGKLGNFVKINADQIVINPDGTETSFEGIVNEVNEGLREDLRLDEPLPSYMRLNKTGIHVDDQYGNNRVRLGQYANGKYGLVVFDKTGQATILDEDGIMQTYQDGRTDNVDSSNPLELNIYIPSDARIIRQALLRFRLLPFRAYSRSTSSGGGSTRTTNSGGGTWSSTDSGGGSIVTSGNSGIDVIMGKAVTDPSQGHSHSYDIVQGHKHNITLPNHSHSFTVPSHTHTITIPDHTHDIQYGIYTSTTATSISVIINGVNRTFSLGGHFNSDQTDLDISSYLNIGQWNTIQLGSSRLGRIDATVFIQAFIGM